MKIFSKKPLSSSRRPKRTIAFTLCAVIGSTAVAVAVDGVRVNHFLTQDIKSTANSPSRRVPSYARKRVPDVDATAATAGTTKARPTRLPIVDAGNVGKPAIPATHDSAITRNLTVKPVETPLVLPAQASAVRPHEAKIAKASSTVPNAIDLTPALIHSRRDLPTIPRLDYPAATNATADKWLRSSTASSQRREALRLLDQAMQEYKVGAWASAEASAWESLRRSAEGIDIAGPKSPSTASASAYLSIARTAIREARDFSGVYGELNSEGVGRIARSHHTEVLKHEQQLVTATDAIDRYLNEARVHLSRLAAARVEAAQAMDLIAAIHLGRNESRTLPNETSLCLRRAALQGQPGNASLALRLGLQLADLGLDQEARWTLSHSMSIEPTSQAAESLAVVLQRSGDRDGAARMAEQARRRFAATPASSVPRVPEVTRLTPEQFASVSPSVMMPGDRSQTVQAHVAANQNNNQTPELQPASYQTSSEYKDQKPEKSNPIKATAKRLLNPFGKLW